MISAQAHKRKLVGRFEKDPAFRDEDTKSRYEDTKSRLA